MRICLTYDGAKRIVEDLFIRIALDCKIFRHRSPEARFTAIYKLNWWGDEESVSGRGSTLALTADVRTALPRIFEKFAIKTFLDAPCGDFHWMKEIIDEINIAYIGVDIVAPLIESHNESYADAKTRFIHMDITKDDLPSADLMLVRDCFIHLSMVDTKALLRAFLKADIKYLLVSTATDRMADRRRVNVDIETGDYRPVDLFLKPYNFPADVLYKCQDRPDTELCLWSKAQVARALETISAAGPT